MAIVLLVIIVTVPAALAVLGTRLQKKRGCGRGCATCGNRELCHPGERRKSPGQGESGPG